MIKSIAGALALAIALAVALSLNTASSAFAQGVFPQEDIPNSWRFDEGVPIYDEEGLDLMDESENPDEGPAIIPWSLMPAGFINPEGELIDGALRKGIDVSSWNGVIDWAKVKAAGIDFAIIRCGYGSDFADQDDAYFLANVRGCIENDIDFGIYLYSYAYTTEMVESEADHALRLLEQAGLSPEDLKYPVYLDIEEQGSTDKPCIRIRNPQYVEGLDADHDGFEDIQKYLYMYLDEQLLGELATAFANKIEAAGFQPGFYASYNWWTNYMTSPVFDSYDRWVAQWNYTCDYDGEYSTWQYTSKGDIPGINGWVDCNFDYDERRCAPLLSDVNADDWFVTNGSYTYMMSREYMTGYEGTDLFGPCDNITRGQAVTILWRMAGEPIIEPSTNASHDGSVVEGTAEEPESYTSYLEPFEDVNYEKYYGDAITWARALGIVTGYKEADGSYKKFGPNDALSRQEFACMLARYAEINEGMAITADASTLEAYADFADVAYWSVDSMAWAVNSGIIQGVETADGQHLNPGDDAKRAEICTMIHRFQMLPRA